MSESGDAAGESVSGAPDRRIYLVRHGEAAASWGESADPGLSRLGHEQAVTSGVKLTELLGPDAALLISSPLRRARETAEPLARALGTPMQIDERFREIPSPVPLAQRQTWLRAFMAGRWSQHGEALHEWRQDLLDAFNALQDNSVVFTHFLVLNAILGWIEDRDETLCYWPANASVSVAVKRGDASWTFQPGEQLQTRVN